MRPYSLWDIRLEKLLAPGAASLVSRENICVADEVGEKTEECKEQDFRRENKRDEREELFVQCSLSYLAPVANKADIVHELLYAHTAHIVARHTLRHIVSCVNVLHQHSRHVHAQPVVTSHSMVGTTKGKDSAGAPAVHTSVSSTLSVENHLWQQAQTHKRMALNVAANVSDRRFLRCCVWDTHIPSAAKASVGRAPSPP